MDQDNITQGAVPQNEEVEETQVNIGVDVSYADESQERNRVIHGLIQWDDTAEPIADVIVLIYSAVSSELLGKAETSKRGAYRLKVASMGESLTVYVVVLGEKGRLLALTRQTPVRLVGSKGELNVAVASNQRPHRHERPKVQIGPFQLDAQTLEKVEPQIVLDIARALVGQEVGEVALKRIAALSPDLVPAKRLSKTLCGTEILQTIDALIKLKSWPREIGLDVDKILFHQDLGFTSLTFDCPNFTITYFIDGPAAVNPDTSSQSVLDPGTTTVLTTLPAGTPPTYIKRVCFWLERALAKYVNPPFGLRNPTAGGKIQVQINTAPYGSATPSIFYLNNALAPDLLCDVAVHELFHMVQFQYPGSGPWFGSMLEGGAVWAEDTNTEMINRYLDEAGNNFNGPGVQVMTQESLETASYKCSLFWRYVSEQQSALVSNEDEPLPITLGDIGVDVYRPIIEACSNGTWSADDIKAALRSLPWYQDFYEFGYLDPARQDLTSSETTLGNYVLACYLKDLDENVPDRRFDFMEGQETIYIDEIIGETPQLGDKLPSVTLAGSGALTSTSSASFTNSVPRFGSRYYEVSIDPGVTSIQVQFNASGLSSSLFHMALIDENNLVREIFRTDTSTYTKQFPNLVAGKRLNKVMLVVTGAASSGNFSLSVNPATAASDVMVTRWNSAITTEYEVDSRNWSWTWVSPDIWVDNDGDGVADDVVFFNFNNQLYIRLHNKGNVDASGIAVAFYYQDASGGLSPTAWLPVQDTGGNTLSLSGLSLPAGTSNQWSVNWSPVSSGASHHFCIRAIVTVPGDPNTDNKRVLSNFGNVQVKSGGFVDIGLLRRNPTFGQAQQVTLTAVPRLTPDLYISLRDLREHQSLTLNPGEASRDVIRVIHQPTEAPVVHREPIKHGLCEVPRLQMQPDPRGYYPPDPRTLPPGVEGRPMVTFVHSVDGLPLGGVTILITVEDQ